MSTWTKSEALEELDGIAEHTQEDIADLVADLNEEFGDCAEYDGDALRKFFVG